MNVHILATCLKPDRLKMTLMVFKTLKIGFPTASIFVYGNSLGHAQEKAVAQTAIASGCAFKPIPLHAHGEWIEKLVEAERNPFWICDTDIIFYSNIEHWNMGGLYAGRHEPEFIEPWTKTLHVERLHPSLMWFNPAPLRAAIREWPLRHEFFDSVESNLFRWNWVPHRGQTIKFYDTCAALYHAIDGTRFSEEQIDCYAHTFCGTYATLTKEYSNLTEVHDLAARSPNAVKDLLRHQSQWYEQHTPA